MKYTIIILGLLAVTHSAEPSKDEDSKEKREAPIGHYVSSGGPHTTHTLQIPAHGHGASNAVSIGAGYSFGGGKYGHNSGAPSFGIGGRGEHSIGQLGGYGGQSSFIGHSASLGHTNLDSNSIGGHGNFLGYNGKYVSAPQSVSHSPANTYSASASNSGYKGSGSQPEIKPHFTLPGGQTFPSLEELMQSLRAAGLNVADATHAADSPAAYAPSQGSSDSPVHQITQSKYATKLPSQNGEGREHPSPPSYSAGVPGLGAYASNAMSSTGPQLFTPSSSQSQSIHSYSAPAPALAFASYAPSVSYGSPIMGHGDSTTAFSSPLSASGHSFNGAGLTFIASPHSFSNSLGGYPVGVMSHALGSGQSFGGAHFGGSPKSISGFYSAPPPSPPFKPSAFLGASAEGSHDSYPGASNHGLSNSFPGLNGIFSKFSSPTYLHPQNFGTSFGGISSLDSHASSSPPRTTYGVPSGISGPQGSYSIRQYKYTPVSYSPSFINGSSRSASSGHQRISPVDSESEHSHIYNTIKYSSNITPKNV